MLRIACFALLLLALAGCTSGKPSGAAASSSTASRASVAATGAATGAKLGDCRLLKPQDVARTSNESPVVACSAPHTAQTFAVGTFPAALAAAGRDSTRLGSYVYDRCNVGFERFIGGDDSLTLRATLSWAWFRPPASAWAKGSHGYRCDVVGGADGAATYAPLPTTAKGLLLGKPADRWMVCVNAPAVTGAAKIPCSQPHTWRAVTSIVLGKKPDPYPGDRLSEVRTRDYCSQSVGAWLNYPLDYAYGYTWFHAAEWKAGNRRSICWAKTTQ